MPRAFSVPFTIYPSGPPGQPSSGAGTAVEEVALVQLSWSTRPGLPDFEVFSGLSSEISKEFCAPLGKENHSEQTSVKVS